MKKLIILIASAAVIASCASKPQSSEEFLYGSKLYNEFQEYYLKGEPELADAAFLKAEAQFQKVDSVCNLSRIYIGRYTLDEAANNTQALDTARRYAEIGSCTEEQQVLNFIEQKPFDKDKLPEPYATINGLSTEAIISKAENDKFDDITSTRLLRNVAIGYIISNPAQAEEIMQKALTVDKYHGWTLNILRDLIIIKSAMEKQNKDTDDIEARIKLVKLHMIKK